eukprot:g1008.t1
MSSSGLMRYKSARELISNLEMDEKDNAERGADSTQGVQVFVRLRPLNSAEIGHNQSVDWKYSKTAILENTGSGSRTRTFDAVLGPESSNNFVYRRVGNDLVGKFLSGFNVTIFAYGQTGSGKTWTIMGDDEGKSPGIIPQSLQQIFSNIKSDKRRNYLVRCSYLEIYNEKINDLLASGKDDDGQNLDIVRDDPIRGAIVGELREEVIASIDDAMMLLERGQATRHVAGTVMNARSSRSHTIFRIILESTLTQEAAEEEKRELARLQSVDGISVDSSSDEGGDEDAFKGFGNSESMQQQSRISYLNLVDLAGSERQTHTKTVGKRLKEGSAINKSLLALGEVISKIADACDASSSSGGGSGGGGGGSGGGNDQAVQPHRPGMRSRKKQDIVHIPYRNSKLTRILRQSLGGNTFTAVIIAMSPAPMYKEESISSLKFGQTCKRIKNRAKKGSVPSSKTLMRQMKLKIAMLKSELAKKLDDSEATPEQLKELHEQHTAEKTELHNKLLHMQDLLLGAGHTMFNVSGNDGGEKGMQGSGDAHGWGRVRKVMRNRKLVSNALGGLTRKRSMSLLVHSGDHIEKVIAEHSREKKVKMLSYTLDNLYKEGEAGEGNGTSGDSMIRKFYKQSRQRRAQHEQQMTALRDEKDALSKTIVELREEIHRQRDAQWQTEHELQDALEDAQAAAREKKEHERVQVHLRRIEQELAEVTRAKRDAEASSTAALNEVKAELEIELSHTKDEAQRAQAAESALEELKKDMGKLKGKYAAQERAMQTLQRRIVGKTGRRLSQAAVGLEHDAADLANKKYEMEKRSSALAREIEEAAAKRAEIDGVEAKLIEKERRLNQREEKLRRDEKMSKKWKVYADIQEEAFKKRNAENDKFESHLQARSMEIERREHHVHTVEDALKRRISDADAKKEKLQEWYTELRSREQKLQIRTVRHDAATLLQSFIRTSLMHKAARQTKQLTSRLEEAARTNLYLDERRTQLEKEITENERHRIELDFRSRDIESRESALDSREKAIMLNEAQQKRTDEEHMKTVNELDKREVELTAKEESLLSAKKRSNELEVACNLKIREAEKEKETLLSNQEEVRELKKKLTSKLANAEVQLRELESRKVLLDAEEQQFRMREERFRAKYDKLQIDMERLREERDSLREEKRDTFIAKNHVAEESTRLAHEKKALIAAVEKMEMRENAVLNLEKRAAELAQGENELKEERNTFYIHGAAKIHERHVREINDLEQQLKAELNTVARLKEQLRAATTKIEQIEGNRDNLSHTSSPSREKKRMMAKMTTPPRQDTTLNRLHHARSILTDMVRSADAPQRKGTSRSSDGDGHMVRGRRMPGRKKPTPSPEKRARAPGVVTISLM